MYTLFLLTVSFLISLILMPIFIWGSRRFGFVDHPNNRKVHLKPIPYMGGVAILISFAIGVVISRPIEAEYKALIFGGIVIVIVGIVDDKYDLKPGLKLIGQIAASLVPVSHGIIIDRVTPFGMEIDFGILAIPITVLWIVGIINAINLVDGLDGLATGVSVIALSTIGFITILQGNVFVMMICVILIGACLGFLVYNFHPAKIFLGDNGAMLLGFIISVVSLMGFKNITMISLFFPIIILAVPFIDMFFAALRRYRSNVSLVKADRSHLHHRLQNLGYTHTESVVLIYFIAVLYSGASIILYLSTIPGAIIIILLLILTTEIIVESTNLIDTNQRPVLDFARKLFHRIFL
ncbi:glycosyltransferase family 4 protein [Salinicoccus hispanicus]|uniref:Undecaprenyl/decaprenyl-phosphate alpha-N-acetylglucosaminyl 1-phosphate transferase n=1 Tax=Salinicoccus hispanicus TaxID=157225 RepID=A0A6N8U0A2_9STAP|nr:MraY family glycosyltransferase [Salinicoccus hispanicus]MXQ50727.1 undecaprenyl/decaprenyl-phosphate alpha-N-acetylglucosaminyl 1-phosphate transferase [Salinicoccus hispanicus]